MTDNNGKKVFLVIIYLIIIILIPLFLDYLFRLTVRKNRKDRMLHLALNKAQLLQKPLIIFNDCYHGMVVDDPKLKKGEIFNGDMIQIINEMADSSCVILVSQALEYVDPKILPKVLDQLRRISNGNLYILAIEKNSPRIFWDYKIKNILEKSFYLPQDTDIKWNEPNKIQKTTENFYSYVFNIIPYHFFAYDPIKI